MPARGHIVAHHGADRLCPFPTYITFLAARDQRQPLLARLAASARPNGRGPNSPCHTKLTIGVGSALDRVLDHPLAGCPVLPAPDYVSHVAVSRPIQAAL